MMIKVIASDIDGTLLPEGSHQLNPRIFDLILKLKEQGIHFIAASGRQLESQQELFTPIKDEISYISENGAICLYEGNRHTISQFDSNLAKRIIAELENRPNCKVAISTSRTQYIKSGDADFYNYMSKQLNYCVTPIDSFYEIQEPIVKIAFRDVQTHFESFEYFKTLFEKEIRVATAGNLWIDFIPFHSNKGVALKFILEQMNISPAEVISFGDQLNDLEMLSYTGTSYAMAHAQPEAQECATYIIDSVIDVLEELLNRKTYG